MALTDVLPDRPFSMDEFEDLQSQDAFDSVITLDTPGARREYLILQKGGTEYILHHTADQGWHQCDEPEP